MQRNRTRDNAFTAIELLVVAAVIAVLATLLLPLLTSARIKARTAACANIQKQWGMAFEMYSADNSGVLFYRDSGTSGWDDPTINNGREQNPYVEYFGGDKKSPTDKVLRMRVCPAVIPNMVESQPLTNAPHSYSLSQPYILQNPAGTFINLRGLPKPSEYLILIDTENGGALCAGKLVANTRNITDRHGNTFNALFGDFHVENIPYSRLQQVDSQTVLPLRVPPWFQGN
jgi:prepilin-type N-terminal cleavage/methylation domain-containing protein/prepilin-type processing-associated H-X9-DG protein